MTGAENNAWTDFLGRQDPSLRALHQAPSSEDDMPVGARTVTRAEMLSILEEQVSSALDASPRTIRRDREGVGSIAAAWRLVVFGQAHAVLTLLHAGFEVEPQANARVCFEHAVALQELALAADADQLDAATEQLAGDSRRFQKRQLDYLDRIDVEMGGANRTLLEAARKEHATWIQAPGYASRQIKDMFERVSSDGALYSVYSRMSEATHAGLASAVPYIQSSMRTGSLKAAAPETIAWAETAAFLSWSCCAAEDAMLRFVDEGTELATRQVELLARIGLVLG